MIPLIPILIAAAIAATAADTAVNIYGTYQTTNASDAAAKYTSQFYAGALQENTAFWDRYIRRHHLQGRDILFPYRAGFNYNSSALYNADAQLISNQWAMNRAITRGVRSTTSVGGFGYGLYRNAPYGSFGRKKTGVDPMYG